MLYWSAHEVGDDVGMSNGAPDTDDEPIGARTC